MAAFSRWQVGNLPTEVTSFVGRRRELAEVKRLCDMSRLVTVTGVGGVGKTRVALRAAEQVRGKFDDGVWWVELSALQDGDLLGHAIAKALRVTDQTARPQLDVLADHLADKHLLLVLDTCEHLIGACAGLAEVLLRSAPGLHILVTSRQPLGVPGERRLAIPPLPVPDPDLMPGDAAAQHDALVLFEERAAAVVPEFTLTRHNRNTVARLCRWLDGIPLAVELAARWLGVLPMEELVARLNDRFQLLVDGDRIALSRHQTLRTTVGWSHELCTPQERLLWARLSVFAGNFDLATVENVCCDDTLPANSISRLVAGLVDKSILLRDDDATEVRYRLLDTLSRYGAEWLHALDEEDRLRGRHRDWYLRLAEWGEKQWFGPGQAETFTRIQYEHANLRAALEFCLSTPGQTQTGLYLAGTLWFYWVGCGYLSEGRYWLDRALALDPEPTPVRAKALWVNGYVAILQGDSASAVPMLEDCRAQALRANDETALAYATQRFGCVALLGDDHARAAALFTEALARYQAAGELNSQVIIARIELAMTMAFQGDLAGAVDICEQVRTTCEEHGERWAKGYALHVLALAAWTRGQVNEATTLAREALRIGHTFHDLIGIVVPVELLALFLTASGRSRHAATLQGAAHRIWRSVGPPLFGSTYFNAPHVECETRARQDVGDQAYEAAFRRGTAFGLDETVAYALGEIQESPVPTDSAADTLRVEDAPLGGGPV